MIDKTLILNELKRYKNFRTDVDFAKFLDISAQRLAKWYARSTFDKDIIVSKFPEVSKAFLLAGEGEMLKNTEPTAEINYEHRGVPYFDVDFIGGFDLVENSQAVNPEYYVDFKPYNNAQYWVNVTGRSMEPNISQGDMIALREITQWQEFLPFGEIYAIVTNEFRTIKVVSQGETPDSFKLIPTNPDPQYSAQDVKKSMIRRVFQVMGAVKRF